MDPYKVMQTRRELPAGFLATIQDRFGDRCSTNGTVCEQHGKDESPYSPLPPDIVVFPDSIDDVVWIVRHCNVHAVPLIPRGAGSSLEGHLIPVEGGVSLDLSGMNRIVDIHASDLQVTVQPGVTREQLNAELRHAGLFFPIDPGADATIGGMVATRASGTNAVRYGTMRENVVGLKVVLADGRIIRTAHRARKSAAGYDLTRLFVGSEGTLGVVVEATIRLYPRPEASLSAICSFPSVDDAVRSVIDIIQAGTQISRVELMDANTARAVNRYSHLTLKELPLLLLEFAGSTETIQAEIDLVRQITQEYGGQDFDWASTPEESSRLWEARHKVYFAAIQLRPGCRSISTDVCVPISRLADCINETAQDLEQVEFPYVIVGHVGDGNFHVQMLLDEHSEHEWEQSEQVNRQMVERAIRMEGTCTGEHGIGLHKREFMPIEFGPDELQLMSELKACLDPRNILNPGKILPDSLSRH